MLLKNDSFVFLKYFSRLKFVSFSGRQDMPLHAMPDVKITKKSKNHSQKNVITILPPMLEFPVLAFLPAQKILRQFWVYFTLHRELL